MFRRVTSRIYNLVRAASFAQAPDASAPAATVVNSKTDEAPIVVLDPSDERKAFEAALDIVSEWDPAAMSVELPYSIAEGYEVSIEGHLRVYANTGLVSGETMAVHTTLRQNPAVAATIKSLQLVIQGCAEIDLEKRDSTMATQRKGLAEWAHTLPALKSLVKITISHLGANGDGVVYVPGEDEAEKTATEVERGLLDASAVIKSLAWFGANLKEIELQAVDFSEEAARLFEGSKISVLRLEACPPRVSSLIPRLSGLSEVVIVEKGEKSVGADYLSLLSHVKVSSSRACSDPATY